MMSEKKLLKKEDFENAIKILEKSPLDVRRTPCIKIAGAKLELNKNAVEPAFMAQ